MNGRGFTTISMHELERVRIIEAVAEHRLKVIQAIVDGRLMPWRAAQRLGISRRQIERLTVQFPELPAPAANGAFTISLQIDSAPKAHAWAVAQFRLAAWVKWPGQLIEQVSMANGAALNGECPEFPAGSVPITATPSSPAVDPPGSIALRLAFVDPVGGQGDITMITVA